MGHPCKEELWPAGRLLGSLERNPTIVGGSGAAAPRLLQANRLAKHRAEGSCHSGTDRKVTAPSPPASLSCHFLHPRFTTTVICPQAIKLLQQPPHLAFSRLHFTSASSQHSPRKVSPRSTSAFARTKTVPKRFQFFFSQYEALTRALLSAASQGIPFSTSSISSWDVSRYDCPIPSRPPAAVQSTDLPCSLGFLQKPVYSSVLDNLKYLQAPEGVSNPEAFSR